MIIVPMPESSATHRTPRTAGGRGWCSHQTPKLSEPAVTSLPRVQSCKNHSLDLRRVNSDKSCSKLSNSGKDSTHPVVALVSRIRTLKGKIFKCTLCHSNYGIFNEYFSLQCIGLFMMFWGWYRGWLGCKHCAIAIVVQCCLNKIFLKNFSINNFKSECNVAFPKIISIFFYE